MITKQDYAIAALVGFLVGVFAVPTLINLGVRNFAILAVVPLAVPPFWVVGVWLGKVLSRWFKFMAQFGKFAAVGFLNTAIDFGVLNILSMIFGVTAGFLIGGVNVPGFVLAVFNGYFWNKFWVFQDRGDGGVFHDFPKFAAVSVGALLLNSAIVVIMTTFIPPFFDVRPETWLNIAKVVASAAALLWNFVGYKFLVFKAPSVNTVA